ncbi:MAG: hypothetical protein HOP17_00095 [Acidobacteria bacterium]|nr:hypothetical protein [Acidobacteriota bacterium]
MNNLRGFLIGSFALLLALQLAAVSSVSAQDIDREAERQRVSAVVDSKGNPEEFRQEMSNYLSEMEGVLVRFQKFPAVSSQFGKDGLDPIAALRHARTNLADSSVEDLVKMRAVYAKFPGWRDAPRSLNSIVERLEQNRKTAGKSGGGGIDNVITPDACPDLSGTPSFADIAITEGFLIAAEAVMEGFPTDGLTILARLIPIAARAALQASLLAENTLRSQYDDCHGLSSTDVQGIVDGAKTEIVNNDNSNRDTFLNSLSSSTTSINNNVTNSKNEVINNDNSNKTMITTAITNAQTSINNTSTGNTTTITTAITNAQNTIVNNDNSNKTMIVNNDNSNALTLNTNLTNAKNMIIANDNTNTTNIVNNDNTNRTLIINNDNSNTTALNDLILRSQIEADLATESNSVKVGWYMTPTANGGKLDLVQQIVTLTLSNIVAAGGSIGNAQMFLDRANADKAAGNFKSAYDNYRKAYKAAVN